MKCLMKYQWVKLPRALVPTGKGVMGAWACLAARAAFRKGGVVVTHSETYAVLVIDPNAVLPRPVTEASFVAWPAGA